MALNEIPRIISVDDHVIEPPGLWRDRCPESRRATVPRVERTRVRQGDWGADGWSFIEDNDDPSAPEADAWVYENTRKLLAGTLCAVGSDREDLQFLPLSYDTMRPGAYKQPERLDDMDLNHTEASLCFPTVSRFCGQLFMNRDDMETAFECVRIYNDWMIDEWCGGPARGRLIPVTLVPMWDADAAAREVRRCAEKGSHAITFSECPPNLGLPSLYSDYWHPLIQACDDTDTVINMHIGSSSKAPRTAPDSFHLVTTVLLWQYGMHGVVDWILSGTLERFPGVRIAMSEAQAGWMPFVLERMDKAWAQNKAVDQAADGLHDLVPNPPSSYVPGRIFGCIYDDLHALESRSTIGMEQLLFETDYPHADSTWDHSAETGRELCRQAGLDEHETWQLIRGNAISAFRLDKYFDVKP